MIGLPWLTIMFAGSAGMVVCMLLFFAVNPLFSAACGAFAGRSVKRLCWLPIMVTGLFLAGAWLFFDKDEMAFLLYGGSYLVIGVAAMLLSAWLRNNKK